MFNIIVFTFFQLLFPFFLRTESITSFIYSFLVPLQRVHDNLEDFRNETRYNIAITAQVLWLEKMLNDAFNSTGVYDNIYITEYEYIYDQIYMGNQGTLDAEIYLSNLYQSTVEYLVGTIVSYNNKNYICTNNTTQGILPTDVNYWEEMPGSYTEVVFMGNTAIYMTNYKFIINIEQTHYNDVIAAKIDNLKALVNKYKIYGTSYTINIYI